MLDPNHPPVTSAALAKRLGLDRGTVACMLADAMRDKQIGGREFNGRIFYHGRNWQCASNTEPHASG